MYMSYDKYVWLVFMYIYIYMYLFIYTRAGVPSSPGDLLRIVVCCFFIAVVMSCALYVLSFMTV